MKFSVIIPVYKAEAYLEKCINSVLIQGFKNFEVILVDDGSPDNCPKICDNYSSMDQRIKVLHQRNSGVSIARNNGINMARGEIVCFLDADDEWKKDFLFHVDVLYQKYPDIKGTFTARYDRFPNGESLLFKMKSVTDYFILPELFNIFEYCRTSSFTVKKQVLDEISLFREYVKRGEDTDLILRLFCKYPIGYCNIPLLTYNVDTNYNSSSSSALYYFPFEEWYNYNYPIKSDLVIHTSGLLIRKAAKLMQEKCFYKSIQTLIKIKFFSYLRYKINHLCRTLK